MSALNFFTDSGTSILAHALCECFHSLADRHDKCPVNRRTIDPFAIRVLHLQAAMVTRLQKVAGQHAIFVWPYALGFALNTQFRKVRILDDLELVLLRLVASAMRLVNSMLMSPMRVMYSS